MSKTLKTKKSKVPKITEAEYAKYIASLKSETAEPQVSPTASSSLESRQTIPCEHNKL